MKKEDLRIGNFVYSCQLGINVTITALLTDDVYFDDVTWDYNNYDEIKPILLTEEWLLKMGFVKRSESGNLFDINYKMISLIDGGEIKKCFTIAIFEQILFCVCLNAAHTHIKYVHQLQNIYYALTGQELEVQI